MTTFDQLGLEPGLLQSISDLGFVNPTPIQEKTIPHLLANECDLLGLAQTGTGKTAAFGLPLLSKTAFNKPYIQGLVICPTRELCLQITEDLKKFAKYKGKLRILSVYGGASISQQIRELRKGVHIVVATAGRMIDIIERNEIRLDQVHTVVLDEADEMLNMGFKEDIEHILSFTPEEKNTWLFSATMPNEIRTIANNFMDEPFEVTVGQANAGNQNIDHQFYVSKSRDRYATLKRLVDVHPDIYGIIFTRTKAEAQEIAEHLIKDGYNADSLHGDLSQQQRDKVMGRFRERNVQILVATDVAARGIDVNDITHVINFSLPDDNEAYTHRSGRTARAGKQGTCMSIIHVKELYRITELERKLKITFIKHNIPTGIEVCEAQLLKIVHQVHAVKVDEDIIKRYMTKAMEELGSFTKEELIAKLISAEFNRFLEYYKNAPDLNIPDNRRERAGVRNMVQSDTEHTKMHINIGAEHGMTPAMLLDVIDSMANVFKRRVGKIYVKPTYTYFHLETKEIERVIGALNGKRINNRIISVSIADGGDSYAGNGDNTQHERRGYRKDNNSNRERSRGDGYKSDNGSSYGSNSYVKNTAVSAERKSGGYFDQNKSRSSFKDKLVKPNDKKDYSKPIGSGFEKNIDTKSKKTLSETTHNTKGKKKKEDFDINAMFDDLKW